MKIFLAKFWSCAGARGFQKGFADYWSHHPSNPGINTRHIQPLCVDDLHFEQLRVEEGLHVQHFPSAGILRVWDDENVVTLGARAESLHKAVEKVGAVNYMDIQPKSLLQHAQPERVGNDPCGPPGGDEIERIVLRESCGERFSRRAALFSGAKQRAWKGL
nr:hypothetical protein Iba_chr06eCG9080 [Ipomoea batatas]